MRLQWLAMRKQVLEHFPQAPGIPMDIDAYLQQVDEIYASDAYHSLSIEGYRVNEALIENVRSGNWNPESNSHEWQQVDALAARGYWQAFQAVKASVKEVLQGKAAAQIARQDHSRWYRALFAPSVTAGLLNAADLAGYRNRPVYIRQSMHVPPNYETILDLMPAFFELLQNEKEPAVRTVLGHFFFVYIHPYVDGNGRMGRYLMNVMLAGGGYPWTVIPLEKRGEYMAALEEASTNQNIVPFSKLLVAHLHLKK